MRNELKSIQLNFGGQSIQNTCPFEITDFTKKCVYFTQQNYFLFLLFSHALTLYLDQSFPLV